MSRWPDYSLTNSIHQLFMSMKKSEIRRLFEEVDAQAWERGMVYEEDDGTPRRLPLMIRPRLICQKQREYFLHTCRIMSHAFLKLAELYVSSRHVRQVLPLPPVEHDWMMAYYPRVHRAPKTVIARWDANTNFSGKAWRASFHFLEVNGVGVGGLHYSPTSERIILEIVINSLRQLDGSLQVRLNDDVRQILLCELQAHLKALGKRRCHIALLQDNSAKGGPLDFLYLERFYQSQGLQVRVIDPREMTVKRGELVAGDIPVDIVYRDTTLEELVEMEKESGPLKAIRKAFAENRVVSGLAGELDHKSALELFSNPEFERFFSAEERKCFRRHVPWTRLVRETKTVSPEGRAADLIKYMKDGKDHLVLKPNRGYGGTGIHIGRSTSAKQWDAAIECALKEQGSFAVQQRCAIRRKKFPQIDRKGGIFESNLNVVCGFIYSHFGLGILGRASKGNIVNVARQGGMTAIMICENR